MSKKIVTLRTLSSSGNNFVKISYESFLKHTDLQHLKTYKKRFSLFSFSDYLKKIPQKPPKF